MYNIFGVDLVNGKFCGNTILCSYYIPEYRYGENDRELLIHIGKVAGAYVKSFCALNTYQVDSTMNFNCKDYGSCFSKSPMGNRFSDKFVLFSMLCQLQFILYCVEKFIVEECSTKLRFSYLLYYYCSGILDEINQKNGTDFHMDISYRSDKFRNAMAHYKVGVALKPEDVNSEDLFFGMTQKFFGCSYFELKTVVLDNLFNLAEQIKVYLNIKE